MLLVLLWWSLLWLLFCAWLVTSVAGRHEILPWLYAKFSQSASRLRAFGLRFLRYLQFYTNEAAAKRYVEARHGDLPSAEEFRREGHSVGFSLAMMPYYLEADERRRERERQARRLPTLAEMHIPASAVFLDPETEDDCPECANGVDGRDHECRTGWKDVLRTARADWDRRRGHG